MAGNADAAPFAIRWEMIDQVERGTTCTLTAPIFTTADTNATATSATVRIVDASGAEVLSTATALIEDGVPTYYYVVPSSLDLGEDYAIEWTVVINDVTITGRNGFAVVLRRLYNPVTDADINRVTSNLDTSASYTPTATSNHSDARGEVWTQCQLRLLEQGRRPWLIVDAPALRTWVLNATVAHIYRGWASTQNDYGLQAETYERLAEDAFRRIQFKWADEEGSIQSARQSAAPVAWMV